MKRKTLIITGAGSNLGYGFLTGSDLRRFLCFEYRDYFLELFRGNFSQSKRTDINSFVKLIEIFSSKFFQSHIKSIDTFLQLNPDFAEVGKIGIICAIARAESRSRFGENAPDAENNDWLSWLFNEFIATALHLSDIQESLSNLPLRFITFNYDRSIEHFFFTAISNALPPKTAANIITPNLSKFEFLNVRHIYGRLACLPWQPQELTRTSSEKYQQMIGIRPDYSRLEYRSIPTDHLELFSQNINLIGERLQEEKTDIANLFKWADQVFFLGFGYAPDNLSALSISENLNPIQDVIGTATGFLDNEISQIRQKLSSCRPNGDGKTIFVNTTILNLLRTYLQ